MATISKVNSSPRNIPNPQALPKSNWFINLFKKIFNIKSPPPPRPIVRAAPIDPAKQRVRNKMDESVKNLPEKTRVKVFHFYCLSGEIQFDQLPQSMKEELLQQLGVSEKGLKEACGVLDQIDRSELEKYFVLAIDEYCVEIENAILNTPIQPPSVLLSREDFEGGDFAAYQSMTHVPSPEELRQQFQKEALTNLSIMTKYAQVPGVLIPLRKKHYTDAQIILSLKKAKQSSAELPSVAELEITIQKSMSITEKVVHFSNCALARNC